MSLYLEYFLIPMMKLVFWRSSGWNVHDFKFKSRDYSCEFEVILARFLQTIIEVKENATHRITGESP